MVALNLMALIHTWGDAPGYINVATPGAMPQAILMSPRWGCSVLRNLWAMIWFEIVQIVLWPLNKATTRIRYNKGLKTTLY